MSASNWQHPMREILGAVQLYSKWGFDVYRTSFKDDELFQQYIDYIRKAMIRRCDSDGAGDVASAATLYTKEEQGGIDLNGLSVDEVRKLHMESVATRERDGGQADGYFMLVNDEVLERFHVAEEELAKENRKPEYVGEGVVVIMCLGYEEEEADDDESDMMWQFVQADAVAEFYNMVSGDGEWWFTSFAWPPDVYGTMA
ncbi:hypothetical protein PG993_008825 [Apiospora rasikravindrae]|uniref:Uncharacterized protein n=1 Tax=Apiospora rasikravindrae TaxID=990691 RepID=A0ABR1SPE9_9PEZI